MGASLSAEQVFRELLKHIPEVLRLPIHGTQIRAPEFHIGSV
jgi:hypothetical protein